MAPKLRPSQFDMFKTSMANARTAMMNDEDWSSLVFSVRSGSCILMLGPHAVTLDSGSTRRSITEDLAAYLRRRLEDENAYVKADYDKPAPVAQAVVAHFHGDRTTLVQWVAEYYKKPIHDSVLEDLATFPFSLVVNTAPGIAAAVEDAYRREKPQTSVAFYNYLGKRSELAPDWSSDSPLVFHLFGSLSTPSSIPISDTDLLDYLVSVIKDDPPLPENLTSTLHDPTSSFLFLGFGLQEFRLRVLLHYLNRDARRERRSFALEGERLVDEGTRSFYQTGQRVFFLDMPVPEFVSQLSTRLKSDEMGESVTNISPDAPVVFLCHASEDKAHADWLASRLRAEGIRTWLDKDNLRGGDNWDSVIETTVKREIGYFLVLQSRNLAAKTHEKSYVNKEINLALEVQQQYLPPRKFLIPILIDETSSRLPLLDELQSIDMTPDNESTGLAALVSDLRRDMERQRKRPA